MRNVVFTFLINVLMFAVTGPLAEKQIAFTCTEMLKVN